MRTNPRFLVVVLVLVSSALVRAPRLSAQTYEVMLGFPKPHGGPTSGLVAGPTGILYGTTEEGGGYVQGSIFILVPDGSGGFTRQNLHSFASVDGVDPRGTLVFGPDGDLYGTAHHGGGAGFGTIFRISPSGAFLRIHDFADGGGHHPSGLILGSDGNFYGVTGTGGDHDAGTVFRLDLSEHVTVLHSFDPATEGKWPLGQLVESGEFLYGTTSYGGANDEGTVYRVDLAGALTTLHEFNGADGRYPMCGLIQSSDGNFYGTTSWGGDLDLGSIFRIDAAGTFGTLHHFNAGDGYNPVAALFQASDGRLYGAAPSGGSGGGKDMFPGGTVFRVDTAGNFAVIHDFITGFAGNGPGSSPLSALADGHDGYLYGTTYGGSTVYRVTVSAQFAYAANVTDPGEQSGPDTPVTELDGAWYGTTPSSLFRFDGNSLTYLHTFGGTGDGYSPWGGLLGASDGDLYGATYSGGTNSAGTIYRYSPASDTYEKIHDFSGTDSAHPTGDLIETAPGDFYGTTAGNGFDDSGSVFHADASGTITPLYLIPTELSQFPQAGPARAPNGDFYTTGYGSTAGGSIFSVDSQGLYTPRHGLDYATEGSVPNGTLLWASDGRLYGIGSDGGAGGYGTVFRYDGSPTLTVLKAFSGDADGVMPRGGLIQASDGNIYGVTYGLVTVSSGTIFRIDASDTFATVHSFNGVDGAFPAARLAEGSDGALYGTTSSGGWGGAGVIYRLVFGPVAPSLIGIAPTSGRAAGGTPAIIRGAHLYQASGVSFGGVTATAPFSTDQGSVHSVSPALAAGALYDVTVEVGGDSATLPDAWFTDFADVDQGDAFHSYVEAIFRSGITAGCGGGSYCRNASVTRAQMSVFILKAEHGATYAPPACQGAFPDVACPSTFADWIEQLSAEGVTAGCGGGLYCPEVAVTRRQMAVFLLKAKEGSGYAPPPATGVFGDVPSGDPFAPWIEELFHRDVTGGCQTVPLLYCPDNPNTRGQMAVFLTKTFELQ
jgi:uncharacterized repeat protein (TIGR03803 family)